MLSAMGAGRWAQIRLQCRVLRTRFGNGNTANLESFVRNLLYLIADDAVPGQAALKLNSVAVQATRGLNKSMRSGNHDRQWRYMRSASAFVRGMGCVGKRVAAATGFGQQRI